VPKGTRGNDQRQITRIFWPNGAAAGKAHHSAQTADVYWPQGGGNGRRVVLWHTLVTVRC
jgi:hypothetical protein